MQKLEIVEKGYGGSSHVVEEEEKDVKSSKFLFTVHNSSASKISTPSSQFITHTMGRVLEKLVLETTPINTKGYETLSNLVENTASDSFDLHYEISRRLNLLYATGNEFF
ncbi:uncharacterized protein LOC129877311 [Solanum dulcamara]|uniref:uncharacterized protein LOC129877311 n=1 Tax=Solanum dulcamara TaxID=45834 RepID=UPI002485C41A|nr:uncharacterized protein LOC129877311 [Solanum dulcamara]